MEASLGNLERAYSKNKLYERCGSMQRPWVHSSGLANPTKQPLKTKHHLRQCVMQTTNGHPFLIVTVQNAECFFLHTLVYRPWKAAHVLR